MKSSAKPWTLRRVLRTTLPWLLAGAMVVYLLTRYSISDIAHEMSHGTFWPLPLIAIGVALLGLASMSVSDWLILRAVTDRPLAWHEVLRGKAFSAMFLVLGYSYSGGAYMLWFNRRTGTRPRTAVGSLGAVALSDLTALCTIITITVTLGGDYLPEGLRSVMVILSPSLLVLLLAAAMLGPRYLHRWIKDPHFLRPWTEVRPRDYLLNVAIRVFNVFQMMLGAWIAAWLFGVEIPFSAAMVLMPIIIFVAVTPLNVAGFGAVQTAWLMYEPWASGERILAFQVLWNLMLYASFILRGLPFARAASNDIADGAPTQDDDSAELVPASS